MKLSDEIDFGKTCIIIKNFVAQTYSKYNAWREKNKKKEILYKSFRPFVQNEEPKTPEKLIYFPETKIESENFSYISGIDSRLLVSGHWTPYARTGFVDDINLPKRKLKLKQKSSDPDNTDNIIF
jgi:hypothetical protein